MDSSQRNFDVNDRPPNFRSSSKFRNFKNPPQPHMCIKDETVDGIEVLINVLSWSRIVNPINQHDPIPLYGGLPIISSSAKFNAPISSSLIFAVCCGNEVLKKTNRNNVDPELVQLVELMCEFVEAMNPGLKLKRKPVVLRDRDLSGELKDIWGAVQAKRETEREHLIQEKIANAGKPNSNLVVYTELGPESAAKPESEPIGDVRSSTSELGGNSPSQAAIDLNPTESAITSNGAIAMMTPTTEISSSNSIHSDISQPSSFPATDNDNVPKLTTSSNNNKQSRDAKLTPAIGGCGTGDEKDVGGTTPATTTVEKPQKKEKSLGFLQNGLFGKKKDKDKESGSGKKETKAKTNSGSFKSKLLRDKSEKHEQNLSSLETNMNALNLSNGKQQPQQEPDQITEISKATTAK